MKPDIVPDTVQAIIAHAGGLGMRGAFVHVGDRDITCRCAEPNGEYRSSRASRLVSKRGLGCLDFEVGVKFSVNSRRGRNWMMVIAYEPDDTYTVWLVEEHRKRQPGSMLLACRRVVYFDTFQSVIEHTYGEAIRDHNQGFIPLS